VIGPKVELLADPPTVTGVVPGIVNAVPPGKEVLNPPAPPPPAPVK
jgi:hypothetical protein